MLVVHCRYEDFLLLGTRAIGVQTTAQVYHKVDKASRQKLVYATLTQHARHREHTLVSLPCSKAALLADNLPPSGYSTAFERIAVNTQRQIYAFT